MDIEDPLPKSGSSGQLAEAAAADVDGGGSIDVEMLDEDEFDFLDGSTHLAMLQSELQDVREHLARTKSNGHYVPLRLYRSSRRNSLSVTDIQSGLWCETQVEYKYLHPHMSKTPQWSKLEVKGRPVKLKTPEMKQGVAIHLKKELEVHEIVRVKTITTEDKWAVQLVNTYTQLAAVAASGLEREIPVFGDPFGNDILINGIIDQVQYSAETKELVILDNKTRRTNSLPSNAQKMGHSLQLMLYKCMLDALTCGTTNLKLLAKHLKLDFKQELTEGVLEHIEKCGLSSLFLTSSAETRAKTAAVVHPGGASLLNSRRRITFQAVADRMYELISGLGLPLVTAMLVQYEYQGTGEVIGVESVEYDEEWMKQMLKSSVDFWNGRRPPKGVDIEDMWKCESCQFREVCVWRMQKQLEKSPAAKVQRM